MERRGTALVVRIVFIPADEWREPEVRGAPLPRVAVRVPCDGRLVDGSG
ncbi:hypothetical protein ACFY7Z_14230 [Streptomyces sp. NPDC012623]